MSYSKEVALALKKLKQLTGLSMDINTTEIQDEEMILAQIQRLCKAYQGKYNQRYFLEKLISEACSEIEISEQASYFHIPFEMARVLFLIRSKNNFDDLSLEIMKNLFPYSTGIYQILIDKKTMVLLYPLTAQIDTRELDLLAHSIVDTLNTEALSSVHLAYSSEFQKLSESHTAYRDASLALAIGELFYEDKYVFSSNHLGVGRLICQLPIPLCKDFLAEIFGESFDNSDVELEYTAHSFIKNNLNIAETSRNLHMHRNTLIYRLEQIEKLSGLNLRNFEDSMTFEIACMIMKYVKKNKSMS